MRGKSSSRSTTRAPASAADADGASIELPGDARILTNGSRIYFRTISNPLG
jgi:hypothetical protein